MDIDMNFMEDVAWPADLKSVASFFYYIKEVFFAQKQQPKANSINMLSCQMLGHFARLKTLTPDNFERSYCGVSPRRQSSYHAMSYMKFTNILTFIHWFRKP